MYKYEDLFSIWVDIFGIKIYVFGVILFEFGILIGLIERWNFFGFCDFVFYGWVLKILNLEKEVVLININGDII